MQRLLVVVSLFALQVHRDFVQFQVRAEPDQTKKTYLSHAVSSAGRSGVTVLAHRERRVTNKLKQ